MPNTYIKVFGGSLDGFAFETVIDAGRRHEGALECCSILLRTELLDLAGHEFNGGLRVPVLVHVSFLFMFD